MPKRVTAIATPVAHLVGPGKLKVINQQLAYSTEENTPLRLHMEGLKLILCYGGVSLSDTAIDLIGQSEVDVAWLSAGGQRFKARLQRADSRQTGLRLRQYQAMHDSGFAIDWAKAIVRAKIESQGNALKHYRRHGQGNLGEAIRFAGQALEVVDTAEELNQLRGIEGSASASWFRAFSTLLPEPWEFRQRVRRPPTDPINALLSLGYTLLLSRVRAWCEAVGLEVDLGCLHEYRPGRPSLVCDLMEPFRVPAVDRWVFGLCKQQQIRPADFETSPDTGGTQLVRNRFATILGIWEDHWQNSGLADQLEQEMLRVVSVINAWHRSETASDLEENADWST